MKILMLVNQFSRIGGTQKQARKLAKKLIERGIEVRVATERYYGEKKEEAIEGIPVSRIAIWGIKREDYLRLGSYTYMLNLFHFLLWHRHEWDIIHIHQALESAFIGVWAGKISGKKTVVKVSNSGERFDLKVLKHKPLFGHLMTRGILKTDKIISISGQVKRELEEFGFRKGQIVSIPNGVEIPPLFSPSRALELKRKLHFPMDRRITIFVGSFHPKKNILTLIKAWKQVIQEDKSLYLVLLGDGYQRRKAEVLVKELGLDPFVDFRGNVENVGEYLQVADMFVLPSLVEGLSNSLLEAMSCGLPCVVSEIPANIEVIENNYNGIVIPPRDEARWAKVLLELSRNKSRREKLGKEAWRTAREKYAMEVIVDKYIQLYQTLVRMD